MIMGYKLIIFCGANSVSKQESDHELERFVHKVMNSVRDTVSVMGSSSCTMINSKLNVEIWAGDVSYRGIIHKWQRSCGHEPSPLDEGIGREEGI